ncbi:hypothetical protein Sgly_0104 [Syntrophobotulus glycolicus DSM 8271]|uniref:DUF4367 domain-containing protein n=1 Tax=Syntrophobotulus glycolicus (strain DSM 8271 / FlGlyR) TaxID=645991 RepID=F0SVJ9_SYNGF|nr:DUF4367 domain-containing protein [Syntrophobotulus glycolicus]ADY54475.1 hypothetical protein Sgly_0104 [Syntrophobotulus glycolicus DSM 8271]
MKNDNEPLNRDKLTDEYEEALIKLAMASYAEHEGKILMQQNEELKNDPVYQPTTEAKRKFKKILNRQYYKQKTKNCFQASYRYLNKAAIIFLFIIILLSISVVTIEAVRIKVLNLFINMQEKYTEIRLEDRGGENIAGNNIYINWDNAYAPTDIPLGYSISNLLNNKSFKTIEYTNDNNGIIIFQQFDDDVISNVDTENADSIEKIKIQGHEGLFVNKDGKQTITWGNDTYIFSITTNLQKEDIIKIAESVNLIK